MTKEQLLDRIAKKEQQIEKINRRIIKWESQCIDEEISIADSFRNNYSKFAAYCKEHNISNFSTPIYELRKVYSELDEANIILNKYKNQLNILIEKESTEKVEIFVDFLKNYKNAVIKYVEKNIELIEDYYRADHNYCDFFNSRGKIIHSGEMDEDEYRQELGLKKLRREEAKEQVPALLFNVYNTRYENKINYDILNEILDKDIEAKYWNMIDKVTKITGEIIDASNLSIGSDGNINGIIIGKEGKAKLETIIAGGYNHNIIVNVKRGQIAHFRLLAHKID